MDAYSKFLPADGVDPESFLGVLFNRLWKRITPQEPHKYGNLQEAMVLFRGYLNLTQEQFAEQIGMTGNQVRYFERSGKPVRHVWIAKWQQYAAQFAVPILSKYLESQELLSRYGKLKPNRGA